MNLLKTLKKNSSNYWLILRFLILKISQDPSYFLCKRKELIRIIVMGYPVPIQTFDFCDKWPVFNSWQYWGLLFSQFLCITIMKRISWKPTYTFFKIKETYWHFLKYDYDFYTLFLVNPSGSIEDYNYRMAKKKKKVWIVKIGG